MTRFRTARPDELPALVTVDGDGERNASTAAYLAELLEKGCTKPEWCFVGEADDGRLTCSAVLWTLPGDAKPRDFVLLEAPWDDPGQADGLLGHVFQVAKGLGAERLGHVVDSPAQTPQFQRRPEERAALLTKAGMSISRDGRRYRWLAGTPVPEQDPRLRWRSLAELGPEPFIDLLERVLADTGDSLLSAEVTRLGLRKAAEEYWADTLEFEHEPEWYEIGYDGESPAVLSLPGRSPSFAVIGFVGVSPDHRGKGYAASIVVRGTHILAAAGAAEIRGDCDAANIGMVKGFERAGYVNFAKRAEYSAEL